MAEYKPHLDALFRDAEALMNELSETYGGSFTNQQFVKEVIRRNPGAYIDLLNAVRSDRQEKWIFNIAHEHIGLRLSKAAKTAHYEQIKCGQDEETDIFGHPTNKIIYRCSE